MKYAAALMLLIMYALLPGKSLGQNPEIAVAIHARVDTAQQEVKEIARLWVNYLNSTPDSLSDNPYWNQAEKAKLKNYDLSAEYLYQFPSSQLLRYYKPTILSIEKEGDNYGIRTIFSADSPPEKYRNSNPWCIVKLYAVNENGAWKLKNALPIITKGWARKTVGKITFVYPPQHKFNKPLAKRANSFCNQLTKEFQFPEWQPFDFYVTDAGDELGKLLNFDFFYPGYTTGIGMRGNQMLLSGLGCEYYAHEFVHLITPKFDRHRLIDEGFATWKGGQGNESFKECAKKFALELTKNDTVTFRDIIDRKWGWQFAAFYATGAILCNAAYAKGGTEMVRELLMTPNNDEKLVGRVCEIFQIKTSELDKFLRTETARFIGH